MMASETELDELALLAKAELLHSQASTLLAAIDALLATNTVANSQQLKKKRAPEPVEGLGRFRALVRAEKRFVEKLVSNRSAIRSAHVASTNIPYLCAVFGVLSTQRDVTSIYRTFQYMPVRAYPSTEPDSVRVDVVADQGRRWVKVKASSLKTLQTDFFADESESESDESSSEDDGESGVAPIPDLSYSSLLSGPLFRQARALLLAAEQNPVHYETPRVVMRFCGPEALDPKMIEMLETMGILVEMGTETENLPKYPNDRTPTMSAADPSAVPRSPSNPFPSLSQTLNLDVTTLICLATDFTYYFDRIPERAYNIPALQLQAAQERANPLLPSLQTVFSGRELVTTRMAVSKLFNVAGVVGGTREYRRCSKLFKEGELERIGFEVPVRQRDQGVVIEEDLETLPFPPISIIDDDMSDRFRAVLPESGKKRTGRLSLHLLVVFGTGDRMKATTVSATAWCERALQDVGIRGLSVWLHHSRSFIEERWARVKSEREDEGLDGVVGDAAEEVGQ
ncbi:hypothetical protein HK104_009901 [Borealophlyctis nickersoniae]|nr:hypothetical protein HK104_009901 [Borealophlyctis nickersoniae]